MNLKAQLGVLSLRQVCIEDVRIWILQASGDINFPCCFARDLSEKCPLHAPRQVIL